jgi:hypothetical protein
MNVSSVSGVSLSTGQSGSQVAALLRQLRSLERELNTVQQSNLDAKTKSEQIKLLEALIQQIEMQIQLQMSQATQSRSAQQTEHAAATTPITDQAEAEAAAAAFNATA